MISFPFFFFIDKYHLINFKQSLCEKCGSCSGAPKGPHCFVDETRVMYKHSLSLNPLKRLLKTEL